MEEIEVDLVRDKTGMYRVVQGMHEVRVAFQLRDEVVLRARDGTVLLVMRTPENKLVATRDAAVIKLFR
jgi:hypothetical protein